MTLLTILGLLLIIFAVAMMIIHPRLKKENEYYTSDKSNPNYNSNRAGQLKNEKSPGALLFFTPGISKIVLVFGAILFMLNGLFFYALPGTAYAVQYLWGGDEPIYSQGIKLKLWGRIIPMSYEIPIQDVIGEIEDEASDIYYRQASQWEFNDAIKGHISTAVVIGIETGNDEVFLNMADRNKSESKLVYARIMPNIDAALKNTCKLISAQDYIAGAAADFDRFFRDQLENGMYILEEYYELEEKPDTIGSPNTKRTVKNRQSSKQKKFRVKRKGGLPVRDNSNSLRQYGLKVIQANVTRIDWEESFDKRLNLQKEQVAQTQLEKQEAEKEFYRTQKEIAKGEAEKAKERARLEKEQIQQTIEAETRAKVAKFKVEEENNLLEAARKTAQRIKVESEAEATKNKRLVQAGLTPQEKAEWDYKVAVGVAEQLSQLNLPEIYISGKDGKNNNSILEELLGAEVAKKMLNSNKK